MLLSDRYIEKLKYNVYNIYYIFKLYNISYRNLLFLLIEQFVDSKRQH